MSTYCVRHIAHVVLYYLISPTSWILLLLILTDGASQVAVVINPPANAEDTRDTSSVPSQKHPLEQEPQPRQYSCLRNSADRGAWRAGCSPRGCKELETTSHWDTHTHKLTDEETGLERVRSCPRSLGNYVIEARIEPGYFRFQTHPKLLTTQSYYLSKTPDLETKGMSSESDWLLWRCDLQQAWPSALRVSHLFNGDNSTFDLLLCVHKKEAGWSLWTHIALSILPLFF